MYHPLLLQALTLPELSESHLCLVGHAVPSAEDGNILNASSFHHLRGSWFGGSLMEKYNKTPRDPVTVTRLS